MRVKRFEATAICHATEDEDKLEQALRLLNLHGKVVSRPATGVYGEPMAVLTLLEKDRRAEETANRLFEVAQNAEEILGNLELRIEGWKLHMRLDKDALVEGKVVFGTGDNTVKVTVLLGGRPSAGESALAWYREHLVTKFGGNRGQPGGERDRALRDPQGERLSTDPRPEGNNLGAGPSGSLTSGVAHPDQVQQGLRRHREALWKG